MLSAGRRTRRGSGAPRRRRAILYFLELLICFGLLGSFGYAFSSYVYESDRFMVQHVRVEGANALREESILEVADIRSDDNLLLTECEAVRRRVEAMSYVKSCTVQRLYPDTIVIRIQERIPSAVLMLNNHLYEIDAEGVVLRALDDYAENNGPLITNLAGLTAVEIGQRLDTPALLEALQLWAAFQTVPLSQRLKVSELSAPAANDIAMFCEEVPFAIKWGRTDYLRQAQLLDIWWNQMGGKLPCKEYLDLRFGDDLVCK
ncbi:MAG: FtsQ-type POTRA domain-containing protein [Candidatus Hydrogenedentes bacterium]|nr:FtsQ-type POTRA domain-containing protein [Candidatus Hydrogenedentota bacterium]MBI3119826.1 FtsQ-type POTRA domain-containing protein [Candidatus Hydrogenedentota bacterium]